MLLIGNIILPENLGRRQRYLIEVFGRLELLLARLGAKRAIKELQVWFRVRDISNILIVFINGECEYFFIYGILKDVVNL